MQTRMPVQSVPSDSNSDWDILYPISAFIEAEKFPVIGHTWPAAEILPEVKVRVMEDSWDENLNTRNITLGVNHEGLIYPGMFCLLQDLSSYRIPILSISSSTGILGGRRGMVLPDSRASRSYPALR
jgi:hypothetical protein